jgi:hypothetical protein
MSSGRASQTQRTRLAYAIRLSEKLSEFVKQGFCTDEFEEVEGHGWRF